MSSWRWGNAHHAIFPHQVFSNDPRFSRRISHGGDKFTVNVGSTFRWGTYDQMHGAVYRQIIDFSRSANSRFIVAPGQSGDPDSRHYDDLLAVWQTGAYLPMRLGRGAVDAASTEWLVLKPLSDAGGQGR